MPFPCAWPRNPAENGPKWVETAGLWARNARLSQLRTSTRFGNLPSKAPGATPQPHAPPLAFVGDIAADSTLVAPVKGDLFASKEARKG